MKKDFKTIDRAFYEAPCTLMEAISEECIMNASTGTVSDYTEDDMTDYFGA